MDRSRGYRLGKPTAPDWGRVYLTLNHYFPGTFRRDTFRHELLGTVVKAQRQIADIEAERTQPGAVQTLNLIQMQASEPLRDSQRRDLLRSLNPWAYSREIWQAREKWPARGAALVLRKGIPDWVWGILDRDEMELASGTAEGRVMGGHSTIALDVECGAGIVKIGVLVNQDLSPTIELTDWSDGSTIRIANPMVAAAGRIECQMTS